MTDTLTVGELREALNGLDDDVDVWVSRGVATGTASSVTHFEDGAVWEEHISIDQ